jgi:hypothetical protein
MSDARLYREMDAVLRAYDDYKVGFRGLLDRLEGCADDIVDDTSWQDNFRRVWGRMEDAYAHAADMGLKQIPSESMSDVLAALSQIKEMVTAQLHKYPTNGAGN